MWMHFEWIYWSAFWYLLRRRFNICVALFYSILVLYLATFCSFESHFFHISNTLLTFKGEHFLPTKSFNICELLNSVWRFSCFRPFQPQKSLWRNVFVYHFIRFNLWTNTFTSSKELKSTHNSGISDTVADKSADAGSISYGDVINTSFVAHSTHSWCQPMFWFTFCPR